MNFYYEDWIHIVTIQYFYFQDPENIYFWMLLRLTNGHSKSVVLSKITIPFCSKKKKKKKREKTKKDPKSKYKQAKIKTKQNKNTVKKEK